MDKVRARLVHMNERALFAIAFSLAITACSPEGTTVTTAITTSATLPTTLSTTSDGETTDDPTTTNGTSTTGDDTETSTSGIPNDWDCLPPPPTPEMPDPPYLCSRAPTVTDFCTYLADSCAQHEVEAVYCEILLDKCADPVRCTACFYLANTCSQVGIDCENLGYECACVAEVAL